MRISPFGLAAELRSMALLLPWGEPYLSLADALRQRATGETPHRGAFDPLEQGVNVAWSHRPRVNVRTHRQCSSGFQRRGCAASGAFNASDGYGPRLPKMILLRLQIEELTTQLLGSARNWSPSIRDFLHRQRASQHRSGLSDELRVAFLKQVGADAGP